MSAQQVVVTDLGTVRLGPNFKQRVAEVSVGLKSSKRSKKHQQAQREIDRIVLAVTVLAEVEWAAGGILEETS